MSSRTQALFIFLLPFLVGGFYLLKRAVSPLDTTSGFQAGRMVKAIRPKGMGR